MNPPAPLTTYVVDPDLGLGLGENETFSLGPAGNTGGVFGVTPAGQLYVANPVHPDFNTLGATFNLSLTVRDAGIDGPVYSASTVLPVVLVDNALQPTVAGAAYNVSETAPYGTAVGTVAAASPNARTLTYSLAPSGASISAPLPFAVGSASGAVSVVGALNCYATSVYTATVTVVDDSPLPKVAAAQLTFFVGCVPQAPRFLPAPAPNGSAVFQLSVEELSPAGANVTKVGLRAAAHNPAQQALVRYAWASPPPPAAALFAVDPVGATITVAPAGAGLRWAAAGSYTLVLAATDANGLTDRATVNITVVSVNTPPVRTPAPPPRKSWPRQRQPFS